MQPVRILFVDDERNIVVMMSTILRLHGYHVTAAETVNEALTQITSAQFDVLISDLNIGHPGDSFTVVSAMRRTQPTCITLILTGYPGFDSALEAIRSQVDDYLIKPTAIPTLIDLIEQKLQNPKPGTVAPRKRLSEILRENTFLITQRTLKAMKSHPLLKALPLSDEQRIEHVPHILEELAAMLDSAAADPTDELQNVEVWGIKRHQQEYTIPLLATRVRLMECAIHDVIHENLLSLNLSYFMFDLKRLNNSLGMQLEHTLQAFVDTEHPAALERHRPARPM